ncbi:MAG: tetratricopeptide repeat protein [Flavobacteriales bacterium]
MDFFESPDDHREVMNKVIRFESMLANQENYYFDCEEFQDIIEYYLLRSDFDKAKHVVDYSLNLHPTSIDLKILKTQVLVGFLKYKDALDLVEEIELYEPHNVDLLLVKGTVLSKLKMSDRAIACFKRCIDHSEYIDEVYHFIASEYQRTQEYEEAIRYFKLCLKTNPENESALYDLNMCFECTSSYDEAIDFYTNLIDNAPYCESIWFNLAGTYSRIEKWLKAVDCYDYALAINPQFASAYFNKANALASFGDFQSAIDVYKESFEYEGPTFITYSYVGECYERLKKYEKGILFYKKAICQNEDYAEAWLGVAICQDGLGSSNEAYASITKAIELDKENPDFWYTASEIEERLGYIDDSIVSMKKAVELDETDLSLALDYLLLLERHFNSSIVEEALGETIEKFSTSSALMYFKTAFLLKQGKYQQGYQCFEQALNVDYQSHEKVFNYYPKAKDNQNLLELIDLYRD